MEVYARVSRHVDWVRKTIARPSTEAAVDLSGDPTWPDSPAARTARRFFEAYNRGEGEGLSGFAARNLSDERRRVVSPEDWARLWRDQRARTGPVRPVRLVALNDNKIIVLAASAEHWRSYRFELQGGDPHRLRELAVRRERKLHGRTLPDPGGFLETETGDDP